MRALLCLCLLALCGSAVSGEPPFRVEPVPAEMKLDGFYKKYVNANGYPVVGSEKVSDYALFEAAYLVSLMLAERPDVRDAMVRSTSRLVVMAYDEYTTDVPEHRQLTPKNYWDRRARGLGGSQTDPVCTCAEENLLSFPGDPYSTECILIHEFAHNIHLRGMVNLDPTFDARLKKTYDDAMARGLWKDKYAATNHHEYFAEGVQSWFDNNRPPDHDHNHVHTRVQLKEYDPGLAAICSEVFGETKLVYTYPATRLTGHLAGYDPARAPTFKWRPGTEKLGGEIVKQALEERRNTADAIQVREARVIEGWTVNVSERLSRDDAAGTARALELLTTQLADIVKVVPARAVAELRKVSLYLSPEYPGVPPTAEYHPDAGWLREHHRDPAMAKGVEFTDVRNFEQETKRMPVFALHELAHAYHDRVLGFDNPEISAAYDRAVASKSYDAVERWHGTGPNTTERAYAMTNAREYFAETSEAYFGRNDFYPFTRDDLAKHDPEMLKLLERVWSTGK